MDEPLLKKRAVEKLRRNVKVSEVQFGVLGADEVARYGDVEVSHWNLYDSTRVPARHGALDNRLGPSEHDRPCGTCGEYFTNCHGHFGHVKLNLPVFHIGYMKHLYALAQAICKTCGRLLLPEEKREPYVRKLKNKDLDPLRRRALGKKVVEECRKVRECPFCHAFNGQVKKSPGLPLAFRHEKYVKDAIYATGPNTNAVILSDYFAEAKKHNIQLSELLDKNKFVPGEDINPQILLALSQNLSLIDRQLLDMVDPKRLIISSVPVPPAPIRPTVNAGAHINEDDLTIQLNTVTKLNNDLRMYLESGAQSKQIVDIWRCLQDEVNRMINSEASGLSVQQNSTRTIRSFCTRLKGKEGRFRGNLNGKRVDFSGRTVISPDPNVSIDEVVVPIWIAKRMTFPEVVCDRNIERLRACVRRGQEEHPGAAVIHPKNGIPKFCCGLKQYRRLAAEQLQVGDVVDRHMQNGDIVLFNRQPSLHRMSIMAHKARVMEGRTFRFNECVCSPYNADFDGDEMNLHFPQGQEARAEAATLMAMKNNIISPKNGEPIVAATQDFLTAGFLLTQKQCFFTRGPFCELICHFTDAAERVELPPPAVLKPIEMWTGKQVFSMMIRPNRMVKNVAVSLVLEERNYSGKGQSMCENDGYVVFRNSELLSGNLGKKVLGDAGKNTLFARLIRDCDIDYSVAGMGRLSKLASRYLSHVGFTIGVDDVAPHPLVMAAKANQMKISYKKVDVHIDKYKEGTLELKPGCNAMETLESLISSELGTIRQTVGEACERRLPFSNKPRIMSQCGSKGSAMNLCQMMACLGQQQVGGSRIKDGFVNRTLPHFKVGSFDPKSRGFVENSFYLGLTPPEFFFHTMGGREGLVDTAVKTAETGYMQRRLTKALEDLSIKYDMTVRTSDSNVVQFTYGEDGLSPAMMETKTKPFDVKKTWVEVRAVTGSPRKAKCKEVRHPSTTLLKTDRREFPASYYTNVLSPSEIKEKSAYYVKLSCDKIQKNFSMECDALGEFEKEIMGFIKDFRERLKKHWKEGRMDEMALRRLDNRQLFMSEYMLEEFVDRCGVKLLRAFCEPGDPVGIVAAQSIGEPATQMTLKTFHFAGVASMNVTLGVPRITELINAAKKINTPIMECKFDDEKNEVSARIVRGRIEKTALGHICHYLKEVHDPGDGMYIVAKIDLNTIRSQLDMKMSEVADAILEQARPKVSKVSEAFGKYGDKLRIYASGGSSKQAYFDIQSLKTSLPKVIVKGCPKAIRAVVNRDDKSEEPIYNLLIEGYGLQDVMITPGVRGETTKSNHVMEMKEVLGIEAARSTIMSEIRNTMGAHGLHIDSRHVQLLGDVMTVRGDVLGINRFGIAKMRTSTLLLASFERTTDHLFDASAYDKIDPVKGVSECIIMGAPVQLGTGLLQLVYDQPRTLPAKRTPLLSAMRSKRQRVS